MPCLPLHLSPSRALPLPCALSPFPPTRPLFIPFRSSSAHSFYPFRSFPLPFRSPTFVWPADNCIREAGYCVTANGGDQNTGVVSVGTMTEDACLSYTAPHIPGQQVARPLAMALNLDVTFTQGRLTAEMVSLDISAGFSRNVN
jgi:hypothetical protein